MVDISFQGATLVIENSLVEGRNVVIDCSDEGAPVDFPDLETCGYAMNLNGELITWTKPAPITFRITVIPGSRSDGELRRLLYAGHVGGKKGNAIKQEYVYIPSATLNVPSISTFGSETYTSGTSTLKFVFSNGRMTGGNPAIGSNAEGKMSARTYNFVFEKVSN